jgi:uncharacterized protein YcbX
MKETLRLQDIFIYPIKSLGGIRMEEAIVEERGFQHDRRWMLVDQSGRFVSQREFPMLSLLQVELETAGLRVFPKKQPDLNLFIPFNLSEGTEIPVVIWDDRVIAQIVSKSVGRWFSDFLGFEVDLVKMPELAQRKVDARYAVNFESVSFADGMPYLIIGQASLDELNTRLVQPVPMNRFRPNLVFSGGAPFVEDKIRKIRIGTLDFQLVKPCARCVLTTINQETGAGGKEPLKTLATYRTVGNKVMFGQNALALNYGRVMVGDEMICLD